MINIDLSKKFIENAIEKSLNFETLTNTSHDVSGGGGGETSSQWLIAKDNLFYSSYSLKKLSEKTLSNVVVFPNLEEIRYFLKKKRKLYFYLTI